MDYKKFYRERWQLVWTLVITVPIGVLALGSVLLPEVFWDGYLYKYLWGPVVADAQDKDLGNISEGYSVVSTLTYAIVLAVAVLGIWRTFNFLKVSLDSAFLIAMVPWIVLGSELRSLEDAHLFASDGNLVYLFISPIIYLLIGLVVFGLVIVAVYIERESLRSGVDRGMMWAGASLVCLNVPLAVAHAVLPDQMEAHAPYWLMPAISGAALLVLWWRARRVDRVEMPALVLAQGASMAVLAGNGGP